MTSLLIEWLKNVSLEKKGARSIKENETQRNVERNGEENETQRNAERKEEKKMQAKKKNGVEDFRRRHLEGI